jgi:hypothetical protein
MRFGTSLSGFTDFFQTFEGAAISEAFEEGAWSLRTWMLQLVEKTQNFSTLECCRNSFLWKMDLTCEIAERDLRLLLRHWRWRLER